MRCDQCKQNDATIFLTQIVEGEITKAALCATCGEPFVQAAAESPQVRDYLQRHRVDVFAEVADRDARYTKEAFWFVRDGVHQAVQSRAGGSRHVTAHELLETLRILAFIIDAIRPAIRFLATGKSSKITAEVTAFAAERSDLRPRHKRPVANISVSQGGLHYPYETGASFSFHDISELNGLGPK